MRAREARAVAARWVQEHAAEVPGYAGALLGGSVAWLPGDAELPRTSDVDLMVITDDPDAGPARGKRRYGGVLLEVTLQPWRELRSPEQVLSSYHLAGLLRPGTVLADPSGRLARLQAATAGRYASRAWVRRRCRDAEQRILGGLDRLDPSAPLPAQVLAWLFPTGVTTHVLLTAGLRNPTIRLRYVAVRSLLDDYGQGAFHEELLALLGCARLTRERVGQHLAAMTAAFDAAAATERAPFPFASDITPAARPIAVDGGRALLDQGHHREAVFWIAATHARCLLTLARETDPGFAALLGDLGVASPADLGRRATEVRAFMPRLRRVAGTILAANPGIVD
jgi:hypothetical protein